MLICALSGTLGSGDLTTFSTVPDRVVLGGLSLSSWNARRTITAHVTKDKGFVKYSPEQPGTAKKSWTGLTRVFQPWACSMRFS